MCKNAAKMKLIHGSSFLVEKRRHLAVCILTSLTPKVSFEAGERRKGGNVKRQMSKMKPLSVMFQGLQRAAFRSRLFQTAISIWKLKQIRIRRSRSVGSGESLFWTCRAPRLPDLCVSSPGQARSALILPGALPGRMNRRKCHQPVSKLLKPSTL